MSVNSTNLSVEVTQIDATQFRGFSHGDSPKRASSTSNVNKASNISIFQLTASENLNLQSVNKLLIANSV